MTTSQYNMSTSLAKCKKLCKTSNTLWSQSPCASTFFFSAEASRLPCFPRTMDCRRAEASQLGDGALTVLIIWYMVCHIIQILHRSVCTFHKFRIFEQLQILYLIYSNLTPSSCMHRCPNFLAHKSNIITLYATILCEPMGVTIVCFDNAST